MKHFAGLLIGLLVGIVGAILYTQSLPPEEGSLQEQAEQLGAALKKAESRIAALEGEGKTGRPGRTMRDSLRSIAEDIRAGRDVDLDRVFDAAKPWMRDLAPIFDRIRVRDQKRAFDTRIGQLSREYNLTEQKQVELAKWFEQRADDNAKRFNEVVNSDHTGLEDLIRASREMEEKADIDGFMESTLVGDDLARYQSDRLLQRVEAVQAEADRKVQRLHNLVQLDEDQKDQVFGLMARGSKEFDPSMQFEGLEGDTTRLVPGQDREAAIAAVLRPEQAQILANHQAQRRYRAEEDLRQLGLSLPPDWDLYDEDDF
jgi:hypothetical protein